MDIKWLDGVSWAMLCSTEELNNINFNRLLDFFFKLGHVEIFEDEYFRKTNPFTVRNRENTMRASNWFFFPLFARIEI